MKLLYISSLLLMFVGLSCGSRITPRENETPLVPPFPTERRTSEVTLEWLQLREPYTASQNFQGYSFLVDEPGEVSFVVYEYVLGEFQPSSIDMWLVGADQSPSIHVMLANYTSGRWELVETSQGEHNLQTVARSNWRDYYSPGGAVYLALIAMEPAHIDGIRVTDSRDEAWRRFEACTTAEHLYHLQYGEYYYNHLEAEGVVLPEDLLDYALPSLFQVDKGVLCRVINETEDRYALAAAYVRVDGGSGLIYRHPSGVVEESQESLAVMPLFCKLYAEVYQGAEDEYYSKYLQYGTFMQLGDPFLNDALTYPGHFLVGSNIRSEIELGSDNQSYLVTVWCNEATVTIDDTGTITIS